MIKIPKKKTIVIFSDTHLTDVFDIALFNTLKKIISHADIIIINGDFWDSSFVTFDKFVTSKWSALFPVLKKKQTYYIYGNHDMKHLSDGRVNLFSDTQSESLIISVDSKTLHIHHGHWLLPLTAKVVSLFKHRPVLLSYLTWPLDIVGFIQHYLIKKGVILFTSINSGFIQYKHKHISADEYLVTAHTHTPQFDEQNKHINSGYFFQGFGSWIEIQQGNIHLKEIRY